MISERSGDTENCFAQANTGLEWIRLEWIGLKWNRMD